MGCSDIRVLDRPDPIGELTRLEAVPGGAVAIEGWTLDPDTTAPLYVWFTVDGKGRHILANRARADIAAEYPGYGAQHGLGGVVAVEPGSRRVCLTASNVGAGRHLLLGCADVVVRAGSPTGRVDAVRGEPRAVRISGWAFDPDTAASVFVWVTVDGAGRHLYANRPRPDIARAFPAYGAAHGFDASIPVTPGTRRVCATVSNVAAGSHRPLGCWNVGVPGS
jgi:hypothetical protein